MLTCNLQIVFSLLTKEGLKKKKRGKGWEINNGSNDVLHHFLGMDSDLIHLISKDANTLIKYILSHSKSPNALSTEIKYSHTKLHYSPTIIQEQQKELNQINHEGGLFTQLSHGESLSKIQKAASLFYMNFN